MEIIRILNNKFLRIGLISFLLFLSIGINLFHINIVHAAPADAYWVGGQGNWTDATNHWATSTGGTPNIANLPDATTNVHVDSSSFTGINQSIQVAAGVSCNNFTWSGVGYSGCNINDVSAGALSIYGNASYDSTMHMSLYILYYVSAGSVTITDNGASISNQNTNFNGGGTYTLQSNYTDNGSSGGPWFSVTTGTLNTNGYALVASSRGLSVSAGATLTLGASSLTFKYYNINIGATVNAGTSIMNCTNTFTGNGRTYTNVQLTGTALSVTGANTFTNLTVIGTNAIGDTLTFDSNQVITGTLTLTGYNSSTERLSVGSNVPGTSRQLTAASYSITNCNISDIAAGNPTWNISAGLNSDLGGNLGFTFTVPQNDYWVGNSGNWSDLTHWASTTGGVAGTGRIPLIQDTSVFDLNSFGVPGRTVTIDVTSIGGVDTNGTVANGVTPSAVTNDPTITSSAEVDVYGAFNFGAAGGVSWTNSSGGTWFKGQNTIPVTGSGVYTFTGNLYVGTNATYMTSVNFNSDFTVVGTIYLSSGTLCLQGFNVTAKKFDSSTTTYYRALNLSTGTFTLDDITAVTKWNVASSKLSVYCGTSTIVLTNAGSTGQSFTGGGAIYYTLKIAGDGDYTLTFNDANTFNQLYLDRSVKHKTIAGNFTQTITGNIFSPTNGIVTISISNVDISKFSGTVVLDWLNFTSGNNTCVGSGGATFYAGINSIGSPQTGWNFSTPSSPSVSTTTYTNLLTNSVTLVGNIDSLGGYGTVYAYFIYGTDPNFVTYSITAPSTPMTGTGSFTFTISGGLSPSVTYYFEAVVGDGNIPLVYGNAQSFTPGIATLETQAASPVTSTTATLNGNLNLQNYTSATVIFEWGTSTSYGNTTTFQTFSANAQFKDTIGTTTPLVAGATYHFIAVGTATNSSGTSIPLTGTDEQFTTTSQQIIPVTSQPYAPVGGSGNSNNSNTVGALTQPSNWWANGGSITSLPFYADFDQAATDINPLNASGSPHPTTMTLYLMAILAVAMAAGYGVLLFTGSGVLALGIISIVMGVGASMTIISGWMVFLILIGGGGLWFLAKYI